MTLDVPKSQHLKLYLYSSALAVNFLVTVIIIANSLSVKHLFYATPLVVQINLFSPLWTTILWIGSFYVAYMTKGISEQDSGFHQMNRFMNATVVGSFIIVLSTVLSVMNVSAVWLPVVGGQLSSLVATAGYVIAFSGSFSTMLMVIAQSATVLKLFLMYFFGLLIPIEIWALMHWIVFPLDVVEYLGFGWHGAYIELQLFYTTYPLIFWFFIAFLFSWIWVPLVKLAQKRMKPSLWTSMKVSIVSALGLAKPSTTNTVANPENLEKARYESFNGTFVAIVALVFSLIVGVFVAYYPYFSHKPGLVGTDSLGYYYTLAAIGEKDLFSAARLAIEINIARVPYHLLLYFLKNLSQLSVQTVIEIMPAIAMVVNILSVFWFVKAGEKNAFVASVAAVFSIFSFTTTVSMHAGTIANWFAVALGFVMFGLILKLLEKPSSKLFMGAAAALISLFLIHYWTALFFIAVLASYLALTLWELKQFSAKLAFVGVVLALAALFTVFSTGLLSRMLVPYGISNVFADGVSPDKMAVLFWTRLSALIDSWFLGALANPVMIGLGLIGVVLCFYRKTRLSRLLISWTLVGALLSILVSPIGTDMNQWLLWRILYLIPFQVHAALGLCSASSKLGGLRQNENDFKLQGRGSFNLGSRVRSVRNQNFLLVLYLVTDFVISAVLSLYIPVLISLVFLNHLLLTLIIHSRIKTTGHNSILVFLFNLLVVLILLNYTLRSLAPLTVLRFQP